MGFADEYHESDFCNAREPRVAEQLRVEGQDPCGLFRVAGRRGFPVDHRAYPVELTDGVEISQKLIAMEQVAFNLDLQVLLWIGNADAIVAGEKLEEMHALVIETIPVLAILESQSGITV